MKLLFKQRFFSWFDSYDIYNEAGETVYTVKGQLAWGHLLKIYDADGNEVGMVKQRIVSFLPKFEVYEGGQYIGCISKQLSLFKPVFSVDYNGWQIVGDFMEWDYNILDADNCRVATVSRELLNFTDTYSVEVGDLDYALEALMLVIAIDAEKCSRN